MGVNVVVFVPGGNVEKALALLKRHMLKSGTAGEIKRRELGYIPPSERRRRKENEARKRERKAAKKRAAANEARLENAKPMTYTPPPQARRGINDRNDRRY